MAVVISRKYEVLGQLGQGGMGVVYKVRHTTLDTTLALKVLPQDLMENQEMVARFYREARVVARFNHPNIVRVSDNDHDDTLKFHYFVMEHIQGPTFAQYLKERGPLPLQDIVNIIRQVANALAYAHNYTPPVIHRDIKPANIMIEDRTGRVVVMDFGIAKELDSNEMTKSGMLLGTLKYCSPEQMRREPLDGRADIYSLGMVMYEAYAGKQFFAGLDETAVIGKVLYNAEEHEAVFTRPAPPAFVAVVSKAIAKSRERRYRRIEDFLCELDACGAAPDDTERTILAVPSLTERAQAESAGDDLRAIEAQIRRLEEERQKRLVLAVQGQAQEARERAARAGAVQWAPEVFQQGLSQEENGNTLFRNQQYSSAQETYQKAERCFIQAYEETVAAETLHQAEHARQEMVAVKVEAERYRAREKARTFYGRALALQAKGDDLWEGKAYREAEPIFSEARSLFADARDLAYRETLREEVATAEAEARAAGEMAVSENAEELSPEVFQSAVRSEQQAATAMGKEEFFQARELYVAARQQYEIAHQQARTERQRRHAPATERTRQRMEEARTSAELVGKGERFAAAYAEVHKLEGQGRQCEEQGEYIEAEERYERARQGYERMRVEAEQERAQQELRERAGEARTLMIAARNEAQSEEARELCVAAFQEAIASEQQADSAFQRADLLVACERYLSAKEKYEQAAQQARSEQQRRQDLVVQQRRKAEHATQTGQGEEERAHVYTENFPTDEGRSTPVLSAYRISVFCVFALLTLSVAFYVTGFFHNSSFVPASSVSQPEAPGEPSHELSDLPSPPVGVNAGVKPATSPEPVPQVSHTAVGAESQQVDSQERTLQAAASESAAAVTAALPSEGEPGDKLTNVVRITKYTQEPTIDVQLRVSQVARALLDEREVSVSPERVLQATLNDLPVGESMHTLRLIGGSLSQSQEVPIAVTYYPGWEIRQFQDLRGEAFAVAFSPDGQTVISSSREKTLNLWNVATGQRIRTFSGHTDWVTSVAFSPDGKTVVSASNDKTLKLWEVATGQRIRTFSGHSGFVNAVAFSPDGKTVVSGSSDRTLKLWEVATGREIRTFSGHESWVLAVAFSPDGKTLLSGSDDKTLKLWDVKTGQTVRTFSGHRDLVVAIAFSPDGKTLVSGSHDKTLKLWDVATGRAQRTLSGHRDGINGVAFSPDGKTLASGGRDRVVKLWEVATGQEIRTFIGHNGTVTGVAFSPDGQTVISGSRDKTLRLWWAAFEPQPVTEGTATVAHQD